VKGMLHFSVEIGPVCNMAHKECPATVREIDGETMPIERVIEFVRDALSRGFEGFVGFHWYNEPTLYAERISAVIDAVPEARYMLVTNGTGPIDPRIEWVARSRYELGDEYPFDTRMRNYDESVAEGPCWRPMVECAIDHTGRIALCCQDWKLTAAVDTLDEWIGQAEAVTRGITPQVCSTCTGRQDHAEYRRLLTDKGIAFKEDHEPHGDSDQP